LISFLKKVENGNMINEIQVKSILDKHKKRDDWFLDDYSVNPYSGCSFNCIIVILEGVSMEKIWQRHSR